MTDEVDIDPNVVPRRTYVAPTAPLPTLKVYEPSMRKPNPSRHRHMSSTKPRLGITGNKAASDRARDINNASCGSNDGTDGNLATKEREEEHRGDDLILTEELVDRLRDQAHKSFEEILHRL